MIVNARHAGNLREKSPDQCGDLRSRHTRVQFLHFGLLLADGLHRQMQHYFESTALGLLGDFHGMCVVRKNGDRQWVWQRENLVSSGAIAAQVVQQDSKFPPAGRRSLCWRAARDIGWIEPEMKMNGMGR